MNDSFSGHTFGRYRLFDRLGAGGMGEAYRAHDDRLGRDVAIKVIHGAAAVDADARRRLRREADALSKLSHPNVATIYDFDSHGDVDFVVMELVAGQTLTNYARRGAIAEVELVRIAIQIAAGLEEAHEHGIIHRHLKPRNIMLTPKGQVKLLDFGLAHRVPRARDDGRRNHYRAGRCLGHVAVHGTGTAAESAGWAVDRRVGAWRRAVRTRHGPATVRAHRSGELADPSELPGRMDTIGKALRASFGESSDSIANASVPLAEVTSRSLEAVRFYTLGKQRIYAGDPRGALVYMQKAVDTDPDFAMAHAGLGVAYVTLRLRSRRHRRPSSRTRSATCSPAAAPLSRARRSQSGSARRTGTSRTSKIRS